MSKRFQLISVADREIMTEYFDTLKEAQARMREEMLDSGLCTAILIATPHYLHPVIAVEGFAKGLHVLTEKPARFTGTIETIPDKGNGDCGCDDFSAWLNDGNNHMDFDWKIIDLEPARCLK